MKFTGERIGQDVINRLSDQQIQRAVPRDGSRHRRLYDGGHLYVVVYPSGKKSFEFRYTRDGKRQAVILGSYGASSGRMTLKAARVERDRQRALLSEGLDPTAQKKLAAEEERTALVAAKAAKAQLREKARQRKAELARAALTVSVVGEKWTRDMRTHWSSRHADQTEQSLRDHVYPVIGNTPIADVEPADILVLLSGMLADGKIETTRRVHQRLDALFGYACIAHKLPSNSVAAAKHEINKRVRVARKAHPEKNYPCVAINEVPQLLRAMRAYVGTPTTRSLFWFVALIGGVRTSEARFATWDEFHFGGDDPHWLIPAARMKAKREHRVPLAPVVVDLLAQLKLANAGRRTSFVFPHPRRDDRPVSENAILYVLAELGYKGRHSGHGYRTMFSTIANESGLHRSDVIEAAMSHKDSDRIRAVYNRANYAAERRQLANWYVDELARLEGGRDSASRVDGIGAITAALTESGPTAR
jgi:integrase